MTSFKEIVAGIRSLPLRVLAHGLLVADMGLLVACIDKFSPEDIEEVDTFLQLKGSNASLAVLLGALKMALLLDRDFAGVRPVPEHFKR